ncbi:hypothetical protein BGZ81_000437 [Podila clonocystis]|nr:hypothetical protein BGZ81_000437 [Podila clonocystis]
MCFGLGSMYGSGSFDSVDGGDSDYWKPNGPASPVAPYQSPYQVVIDISHEVDYGFHSTCQEDRQYERDVGWNSSNYYTSYFWARYLDGNRPAPCSSIGPFDRLPHYRRDWWYRGLFKEGLAGAYERIGLSFFLGLIPVIGSIVCLLISYAYVARPLSQARLRPEQLRKFKGTMWKLLAIDFLIGLIFPIGPFFRAWFHCNMRIIHFAFDAKNEHESYVDYLYYQNSGRIRVADLNKAHALAALQMYQQYHQECIHSLYGAELMNATDHAVLHEDLARLQRELSQARTCQIKMENERIKSCNAAQPLIRRTMSNSKAPQCYHAIPPTTAWSDQCTGLGLSALFRGLAVQNRQFVPQQEPLTVQLAEIPQEQVLAAFQPPTAPELPVAFQTVPTPPLTISFQHIPAPQHPVAPTLAPPQPITPQQAIAPWQATASQQAAPVRRNMLVYQKSAAPRSLMVRPQRIPAIYQPMPPRRQALVLCRAPRHAMLQTRQSMYASRQMAPWPSFGRRQVAPRPAFVHQQTMKLRQGGLVAQKAVPSPSPMHAIETPVTYQQAIVAQQALSSLRVSQEAAILHQPLSPEHAVVPVQLLVLEQADDLEDLEQVVPGQTALGQTVLEQVIPEQTVTPEAVGVSPIDCAVAPLVRPHSNVFEAAPVSPSTIQTYMVLMQQRMVQVDQFNPSSIAPTSARRKRSVIKSILPTVCIDPPHVSPALNGSSANPNGETAPRNPAQEAKASSSRTLVVADPGLIPDQRRTIELHQAPDTHSPSPIVIDTSGLHHLAIGGLQDMQDALPEKNDQPINGTSVSGLPVNGLAARQLSLSLESDVTATEPGEQAIWDVQSDSEDVYGDDEAEDDSSDDDDSEDECREGGDAGEGDGKEDDKSGGDSSDQGDGDGDGDDDGSDDKDDDGDNESTDDYSNEEYDYSGSDKEEHYQNLMRNFDIATSLNKANDRLMSSLSTLLALELSEFSESNLASRRYSGHQNCYGPSPVPPVSTFLTSGTGSSKGGRMPVLSVRTEHNTEHSIDTSPGASYPQVLYSDSETRSQEKAIEKVLSRRWELKSRNRWPQRLIGGPRFDID